MKLSFTNGSNADRVAQVGWESIGVALAAISGMLAQLFDLEIARAMGDERIQTIRWFLASGIIVFSAAALVIKMGNWST